MDSLSYNSFEKLQKNDGPSHWNKKKSDDIEKAAPGFSWEGCKTQKSPKMDHATFTLGLSTLLGMKERKNPLKASTFDSRNDSKQTKDQSRLKTEEAVAVPGKQSQIFKIKPIVDQIVPKPNTKFQRPLHNKSFLAQSNVRPALKEAVKKEYSPPKKSSFKANIYRFNSKQASHKPVQFGSATSQAKTSNRPAVQGKNQPISCFIKHLPEKDRAEGSVGPLIEQQKTLHSLENDPGFNAFDTLQKTSYNHCGNMEEHSGIIYASIPTNDKNKNHEKSRDSKRSKFSNRKNLSFNDSRRNTLKTLTSIDKKMRSSLLEPRRTSAKEDYKPDRIKFDKKFKPLVYHTENEFKAPGLETRLDSLPHLPQKCSHVIAGHDLIRSSRLKKKRVSSSQPHITGVLRKNHSLNGFSEMSNMDHRIDMSHKASLRCMPRESGPPELDYLRTRIKSLEHRLKESNKEVSVLQSKHKELSEVFLRVVSENVTLKMINQQERPELSGREHELRAYIEKAVAELFWPDFDNSSTPQKNNLNLAKVSN